MQKLTIENEKEFELAIRRLYRWYELRDRISSDSTVPEEERAYHLRNDNEMIQSFRVALRDYLDSTCRHEGEENLIAPESELARAA